MHVCIYDTEEFYNPKITKVEITVEGSPRGGAGGILPIFRWVYVSDDSKL